MPDGSYFSPAIETMGRDDLDALIDERVRYTVQYAAAHSPFYRHWFRENNAVSASAKKKLAPAKHKTARTIAVSTPPV